MLKKLMEYLDQNEIKYVVISHSTAYTAQEVAESAHIPGKELAKTVMVKVDGKMTMAVLPASFQVNFEQLKNAVNAETVELASEQEFQNLFPNCELGAMPPFGNLFGMDVIVAQSLTDDEEIAFNAGTHFELVKLAYQDLERLVQPVVVKFSIH